MDTPAAAACKASIYQACTALVAENIRTLTAAMNDLKASIAADTKSSAGDKHETSRAHLQAAQEQAGRQLAAALAQQAALEVIDIRHSHVRIVRGSLVHANGGWLFVSVALGKVIVDGVPVTVLSPQSPLGAQLLGLAAGGRAVVNGKEWVVAKIC